MRLIIKKILGSLLALQATYALADNGKLFYVTTGGAALGQSVSYTLCLKINGKNPLSCQNYSTSNATLTIKTAAPHHTYHYAGIKINTPGFRYTGQGFRASTRKNIVREMAAEGYTFIGTVSDTQAKTGTVSPTGGGNTALSLSLTDLVLSISGLTLDGQASGQARIISITNTGDAEARALNIVYPVWPVGTYAHDDCGTRLAAGASCTITVTPGTSSTSNCSASGIVPTPGEIAVSADNATAVSAQVVVLGYGCIYQGGYLFAMTETADTADSIGGKVATQTDQADRYPNGVVWSSNGTVGEGSFDIIPGIVETSTAASPMPTYSEAQSVFDTTYSNTDTYPFPAENSFLACNGAIDGACNSVNILVLYTTYITNAFALNIALAPAIPARPTLQPGPTDPSYYAAGLCSASISGYTDWYLPAICEMGYDADCPATQNMATNLLNLLGVSDDSTGGLTTACAWGNDGLNSINCLAGYYWSSTERALQPKDTAFLAYFSSEGSQLFYSDKFRKFSVRCVRALTP